MCTGWHDKVEGNTAISPGTGWHDKVRGDTAIWPGTGWHDKVQGDTTWQGTGWHRDMTGYRYRVTPGYDRVMGYRVCYDTFMLTWCRGWHCVTGWHCFMLGYRVTPINDRSGCRVTPIYNRVQVDTTDHRHRMWMTWYRMQENSFSNWPHSSFISISFLHVCRVESNIFLSTVRLDSRRGSGQRGRERGTITLCVPEMITDHRNKLYSTSLRKGPLWTVRCSQHFISHIMGC